MRRAKIVCTMGPAVESPEKVKELIDAGMNMARLNLSHGSYEEHQARLDCVRDAAKAAGRPVAILVDLQGPKIRLARFKAGPHDLARGDIFTITVDDVEGTKERVGTTYKGLPGDCKAGDRILIDDGKVTVEVVEVKGNDVITKVIEPGAVSNNKGINLPGVAVSVPALSEKDIDDLRWGLRAGADFIALSFVRSADDIKDVHKIMDEEGIRVPVIAKIEKPQAVENRVEIKGPVYFPGAYALKGDERISDLIAKSGGLREQILLKRAYLIRTEKDDTRKYVPINIQEIVNQSNSEDNILLKKNDVLLLYSEADFLNRFTVTTNGEIKRPATFPFKEGITLGDVLVLSGGLQISAEITKIEIARSNIFSPNYVPGEEYKSTTISLTIPKDVPVLQFWALTLYSENTRRPYNNGGADIQSVSLDSKMKQLQYNEDGSIDLFIGKEAPKGMESNFMKTTDKDGWFVYFRLYAPTQPFFDKTFQLNDFELVEK